MKTEITIRTRPGRRSAIVSRWSSTAITPTTRASSEATGCRARRRTSPARCGAGGPRERRTPSCATRATPTGRFTTVTSRHDRGVTEAAVSEHAFLKHLNDSPDDLTTLLVYADWLEDQG